MKCVGCGLVIIIALVCVGCGRDAANRPTPQPNGVNSPTPGTLTESDLVFERDLNEGDFGIKMPFAPSRFSPPTDPPRLLKLRLRADGGDDLESMRLDEDDYAPGDWDGLRSHIIGIIGDERGPDSLQQKIQLELDCDYNLRHEHVIDAISTVSGYRDENDNVVRLVEKVKFSPYKNTATDATSNVVQFERVTPAESEIARPPETAYQEMIGLQLTKSGNVLLHGNLFPMDAMPGRMKKERLILQTMGIVASDATVVIRADKDCPVGKIQQLIRICQEQRFERFALRVKMNQRDEVIR